MLVDISLPRRQIDNPSLQQVRMQSVGLVDTYVRMAQKWGEIVVLCTPRERGQRETQTQELTDSQHLASRFLQEETILLALFDHVISEADEVLWGQLEGHTKVQVHLQSSRQAGEGEERPSLVIATLTTPHNRFTNQQGHTYVFSDFLHT